MRPVGDAALLRFLIDEKGDTQAATATGAGIAESTVSAVLAGKRALTRAKSLSSQATSTSSPARFNRNCKQYSCQLVEHQCCRTSMLRNEPLKTLLALIEKPGHVCYRYRAAAFEPWLREASWRLESQALAHGVVPFLRQLRASPGGRVFLQRRLLSWLRDRPFAACGEAIPNANSPPATRLKSGRAIAITDVPRFSMSARSVFMASFRSIDVRQH